MSDTVEELVESYINGNRMWVAGKLQKARKVTVLEFAQALTNATRGNAYPENGIVVTKRLLEMSPGPYGRKRKR